MIRVLIRGAVFAIALLAAGAGGLPGVVSGFDLEGDASVAAHPSATDAATTTGGGAGARDGYPLLLVPPPAAPSRSEPSMREVQAGSPPAAITDDPGGQASELAAGTEAAVAPAPELRPEQEEADARQSDEAARDESGRDDGAVVAAPAPPAEAASPGPAASMVALMNEARAAAGLPPLAYDSALAGVAVQRSADMVQNGYFAHIGPDGQSAQQLLAAAGVTYRAAGENLARVGGTSDGDVSGAVAVQLRSETHRANLLSQAYTHIGVGYAADSDGVAVFTVILADR